MRLPVLRGIIDRRILVNYRISPDVLRPLLPPPFEPRTIHGSAMGGICLIRFRELRPRNVPAALGLSSENAAHRFAVEWSDGGVRRQGVYVHRRDTSSHLSAAMGGRLFPGQQHHATFEARDDRTTSEVALRSDDGVTRVAVAGTVHDRLPPDSIFESLGEASRFFEEGSHGYSPRRGSAPLDGMELRTAQWSVFPLAVKRAESSVFDDPAVFPPGSVAFDCALVMRDIAHEWHALRALTAL